MRRAVKKQEVIKPIQVSIKNFHEHKHILGTQLELTENFDGVETPSRMQGVNLYPHQATIVKAMLDIEDKGILNASSAEFTSLTNKDPVVTTSAMVLSEPFGSGKTIELLAFILLRPRPRAFPTHLNSVLMIPPSRQRVVVDSFQHQIMRKFTGQDSLLRPNLIVVGSAVLVQWEQAIKDFTDLRYLVISDYYKLKKFIEIYNRGDLNKYEVVLLKNGKVSGKLNLPDDEPGKDLCTLITAVGKITQTKVWSRVIYDDFDTIAIPANTLAINALFTIYVSATTKAEPSQKAYSVTYPTILDAINRRGVPLNLVTKDTVLFSNFNVRNTSEFTEISTSITQIQGYRYVYANPDDNYIRLLGAMGEQDALNIMEMLNGDAIATAAETMGVKTDSVAAIFEKVLDKKYEKYIHDQNVLELLGRVQSELDELEPHEEGKKHSQTELDAIRSSITKEHQPNLKFYSDPLAKLIDELIAEFKIAMEEDGRAINRVKDNIKEGMCQVCNLPLNEFDTFIVRCCGLIVCDVCGIKGNQIQYRYDYKSKAHTVCGSCANCKATIYPQKDLIFVDRDFDMEALLKAKGDEKPAEPLVEEVAAADTAEKSDEPEIKNPKLKALRQILLGEVPDSREHIPIKIKHLLLGRKDIPPTDGMPVKALVFANFNETLNLIENFLVEHNIEFLRLGGTFQEKADTVKMFKNKSSIKVLLINSQQNCAGLNLQFCTDLVFFHKLTDQNIESQVAGRGQRIGRTCNLRIHYLAYKNEKDLI